MPLDEADKKFILEAINASETKVLGQAVKTGDFAGWAKKIAEETVTPLIAGLKPKEPEPKPPTESERVTKLENELTAQREREVEDKKEVEIRKALSDSKIQLVKGAEDLAMPALKGMIKHVRDEKGNVTLYVDSERMLPATKETIKEKVDVVTGVMRFFESRPGLKATEVVGGVDTGKAGSGSAGSSQTFKDGELPKTLVEAMRDPKKFMALKKSHPDHVRALQRASGGVFTQ